jgi:hypothetical protein
MATSAPSLDAQPAAEAQAPGYMRGSRDLRIDVLRGYAIFAMVVDHVSGEPSWLYAITGGDRWYVSAAEAFVFLSGVVAGIVYGPRAARLGGKAAAKLLRKAGIILAWATGLTLAEPFAANALQLGWDDPLRGATIPQYVVSVLTLNRTYHLTDVLLLYALLFSVAGTVIVWMVDGHTKFVLAISWSTWAIWQTATDYPAPWDIQAMTVFQFAAWQALFITGLAIGIHRQKIMAHITPARLWAAFVASGLAVTGFIVSYQLRGVNRGLGAVAASHLLSKSDLGPGRLVVFVFVGVFAYALTTLAWRWIQPAAAWLLAPLGQHSLMAYILHVGVVMVITKVGLMFFNFNSSTRNALLEITGVLMVWGLIRGYTLLKSWISEPFEAPADWGIEAGGLPAPVVSLRQMT